MSNIFIYLPQFDEDFPQLIVVVIEISVMYHAYSAVQNTVMRPRVGGLGELSERA
jgi:hypothetical protein